MLIRKWFVVHETVATPTLFRRGGHFAVCVDASEELDNLFAPVYDWFTEGFDTADLKDAKALLEELK